MYMVSLAAITDKTPKPQWLSTTETCFWFSSSLMEGLAVT